MTTVVADMSVSLDGFVADPSGVVDRVFAWYGRPQPREPTAGEAEAASIGVIVYGRRTFETARGWGGSHPAGAPVIIVTPQYPGRLAPGELHCVLRHRRDRVRHRQGRADRR